MPVEQTPNKTVNVETENIAATLARVLPEATQVLEHGDLRYLAIPKSMTLEKIDMESLLEHPRRAVASARMDDFMSFIDYVTYHAKAGTTVWCAFNPQTYSLSFVAVLDEHAPDLAGWRSHKASFTPDMSVEWKAWKEKDGKFMEQVEFAEWLEAHEEDISEANGLPTLLQMKTMANNFIAHQEKSFRSAVRLQDGSINMGYVDAADDATVDAMKVFERFCIAIPVFYGDTARWQITARLKYRVSQGKVKFMYELVRPDKMHKGAAEELINQINSGVGAVNTRLGSCT